MAHDTEPNQPSGAATMFGDFAPALVHFTDDVFRPGVEAIGAVSEGTQPGDGGQPDDQ